MSKRTKYSGEEKYIILQDYDCGDESISQIIKKYDIAESTFFNWRYRYEKYGINGLVESKKWKRYSQSLKDLAIKDYLTGKYSKAEITRKYELSSETVLKQWITKYNNPREIKPKWKGMKNSMDKGRFVPWSEKLEVVLFCISQEYDYQKTATLYSVSYASVYQWVSKYKLGGKEALIDRRGRKKNNSDLTIEDKLKLELRILELENNRLKAENEFLKKLEELERRRF